MRLDGFLAHSTELSRKDARQVIRAGRVALNGAAVRKASTPVSGHETVSLDGQPVSLPGHRYLMLNKPPGLLSATSDASQPVVNDLLPDELAARLHPVGRLDMDTTGLLLMTSDGQWSHRITSPRHRCPKTYRVTLAEPLSEEGQLQLSQGLRLRNEPDLTRPANVERLSATEIDLTITEGRYHQVKRMIAAIGNHLESLHRHRIGSLSLDGTLAPGEFRHLTEDEVHQLATPE